VIYKPSLPLLMFHLNSHFLISIAQAFISSSSPPHTSFFIHIAPSIRQKMRDSRNYHWCYSSVIICSVYSALSIKFSFWSPYHYAASTMAFSFIHQTRRAKLIFSPVLYTHTYHIIRITVAKSRCTIFCKVFSSESHSLFFIPLSRVLLFVYGCYKLK